MHDELGDRIKSNYEDRTRYSLPRRTYTIIRLDGRAFHSFMRGFDRPFDENFAYIMDSVAIKLAEEISGCCLAYVQSDEISLVLTDFEKSTTDAWFGGNIQKMCSISASLATSVFQEHMHFSTDAMSQHPPKWFDKSGRLKQALFDSRVFTIPDRTEVVNYFIWRQSDASRNSVNSAAQALYSHAELEGKSISDCHELLFQKGINWNDYPIRFKRGYAIIKSPRKFVIPAGPDKGKTITRERWIADSDTPIFSQNREYLTYRIPLHTGAE